jgi:hypothetical protein
MLAPRRSVLSLRQDYHNQQAQELIMGKVIVSENKNNIVLSSHKGLPPGEIVQDCLEKAQSMLLMATSGTEIGSLPPQAQHQYLCLLDDLVDLAITQYSQCRPGRVNGHSAA